MGKNKSVYLAWQAPDTRGWHVVGLLEEHADTYVFGYTRGAKKSEKFIPFSGMEDLDRRYRSRELFPLFKNRVLSPKRPEYPHFIQWLGLSSDDASPIAILERSGGLRATDQLQVFKRFEIAADGSFAYTFFAHGLSYLPPSAQARVSKLVLDEKLFLCHDMQNPFDEHAIIIRSDDPAEIVGYCPRYLAKSLLTLLPQGRDCVGVTVAALRDDAPANYKLLCKISGQINPAAVGEFMADDEFQLLA